MPRCGLREVQYLKIAIFNNMEIFWEMGYDFNMYIINVIADYETKIGLYEI
jgi:hypothetical protein